MRQTIKGLVAAVAVVTASAAPAMACGSGLFSALSSCSPCQSYSPCGGGSYNSGYYGGGYAGYQRLPDPEQQYYYVNQGPTYSGPGNFAPVPTYQESAVSGWNAYSRPYQYGYDGGRYANATNHYYDGAGVEGPAVYSYRSHRQYRSWRPRSSYYHAPRMHRYGYAPRHSYAPRYHRYDAPRHYGHRQPVLRRYY